MSPEPMPTPLPTADIPGSNESQLPAALQSIPDWEWLGPGAANTSASTHSELRRRFDFASFEHAIVFLQTLIAPLDALGHHPRIENEWRSVAIHFTTWDAGHRVTAKDVEAASRVDQLYAQWIDACDHVATMILATSTIQSWHAHIYFDAPSREAAWAFREQINQALASLVAIGRFHEKPVGPHPMWSYQLEVGTAQFPEVLAWLTLNHGALDVFVHPNTGDQLRDHRDCALWLGRSHTLDLSAL